MQKYLVTKEKIYKIVAGLAVVMLMFSVTGYGLVHSAFAWTFSNGYYSHEHATILTNPSLVCGNHPCGHGETPQHPKTVEPVKGKSSR